MPSRDPFSRLSFGAAKKEREDAHNKKKKNSFANGYLLDCSLLDKIRAAFV